MGELALPDDVALLAPREQGESDQEYEMFAYYVSLPISRRTARAVAAKFGVAVRDVVRIAMERDWVRRAKEHDLNLLLASRSELATELIAFASELVELGRQVSRRILGALPTMEFGPSHVDRLVSALTSLATAVSALTPGASAQQQQQTSIAAIQSVILMHLQNAARDADAIGIRSVVVEPGSVD